jgi:hypothetical protein
MNKNSQNKYHKNQTHERPASGYYGMGQYKIGRRHKKNKGQECRIKGKLLRERKLEKWKVGMTNMNEAKH